MTSLIDDHLCDIEIYITSSTLTNDNVDYLIKLIENVDNYDTIFICNGDCLTTSCKSQFLVKILKLLLEKEAVYILKIIDVFIKKFKLNIECLCFNYDIFPLNMDWRIHDHEYLIDTLASITSHLINNYTITDIVKQNLCRSLIDIIFNNYELNNDVNKKLDSELNMYIINKFLNNEISDTINLEKITFEIFYGSNIKQPNKDIYELLEYNGNILDRLISIGDRLSIQLLLDNGFKVNTGLLTAFCERYNGHHFDFLLSHLICKNNMTPIDILDILVNIDNDNDSMFISIQTTHEIVKRSQNMHKTYCIKK